MKKLSFLILIFVSLMETACNAPVSIQESVAPVVDPAASTARFAGGAKMVRINTSTLSLNGSFTPPSAIPGLTPVPSPFPGYSSSAVYKPGVSATRFYDVNGTTSAPKPAWLYDFQLGLTSVPGSGTCATFGGSGNMDVSGYYRASENNCAGRTGLGSNLDDIFLRVVLNRNSAALGTGENLLIQVEYQASGLRLNSDGSSLSPEDNVDQLWKFFWNTSLASTAVPNIFSVFVPPNYAACSNSGSGAAGAPGNCTPGYKGAPITVKQIIVPLSAYPAMSVIQLSRVKGRINNPVTADNYVGSYLAPTADCTSDSPLCLGLVIRSVLLMRI